MTDVTREAPELPLPRPAPDNPTPDDTAPEDATLDDTTPDDATPADATPADATPADATPDDTAPTDTAPDDATPVDRAPGDTAPEHTAPDDAEPGPPVSVLEPAPPSWTADEMMTIAAARSLRDGQACFVGIGLPSTAANLARRLHAPDLVLIYESGALGSRPGELPLSIGDGILAESALTVIGVPEVFNYWLQPGRIDVGFLSGAQIDRLGNINTTVIGSYDEPAVRLPGSGGAPEIAAFCREVTVVMRHQRRAFVEQVDFVTSVGHGTGPGDRALLGLPGAGPVRVITDLGVLEPDRESAELVLTALHPGITVEQVRAETGWTLQLAAEVSITAAPTAAELATLRGMRTVESSP
jgi:glutaconate CoA-transferase, subunit B